MNNSSFGYDCIKNADNWFFAPVFHKIEELSYVKRYQNVFDPEISDFVSTKLLEREIDKTFENKLHSWIKIMNFMRLEKNLLTYKEKRA